MFCSEAIEDVRFVTDNVKISGHNRFRRIGACVTRRKAGPRSIDSDALLCRELNEVQVLDGGSIHSESHIESESRPQHAGARHRRASRVEV